MLIVNIFDSMTVLDADLNTTFVGKSLFIWLMACRISECELTVITESINVFSVCL